MEISKPDIKVNVHEELFRKYFRVLKLARTPTREEFTKIATVAAAGVLLIGLIGFIIYLFFDHKTLLGILILVTMTPVPTPASPAPSIPAAPEVFNNRIFAIKTTSKQERTVADNILKAIETKATDIKVTSIIVPNELQGYVLVETPEQRNRIEQSRGNDCPCPCSCKGPDHACRSGAFPDPETRRGRYRRGHDCRTDRRAVQG